MSKRRKSNKILYVLLGIILVCFLILGFGFYKYFYAGSGESNYGSRLQDKTNYPLSDTLEEDVRKLYSDNEVIDTVNVNVKGNIVYINISFKDSISSDDAKSAASKALEAIGEDNLTYYDVQYVLTSNVSSEANNFPIFGAKNSNSDKIVW